MEEQKLGTDVLKEKFGEITPQITYRDGSSRVVLAVAEDGRVGAYSIVHFDDVGKSLIPDEIHRQIIGGKLIGKTIRESGIPFERDEECTFVYRIPKSIQSLFNTDHKESFVKRVNFKIGTINSPYASIVEIYSPLVSFSELDEKFEGSVQRTIKELNLYFKTKEFFIRNVREQDLEKYLRLAHEFLKKPMHIGIENKEEFVRKTLDTGSKLMQDQATILIVAQKENDFIGYLAANIHPALHVNGFECMIRELYTQNSFRRQGIALSLVRTLERIAHEKGAKRISLATHMDDGTQSSFYGSLGYARRCDFVTKYLGET